MSRLHNDEHLTPDPDHAKLPGEDPVSHASDEENASEISDVTLRMNLLGKLIIPRNAP
ncbi:hypothetical protein [Noviherbaspirillum saxi]|uniref:hypothetical protein n=1 Tax=Noviherbaspirillum saxi TaxID=2320863 RepID=UPI0013148580|nr:hypothetical protein [Noviherbaspirillum saxi]